MLKLIEGFHHQVVRRIMGITARHMMNGDQEWPLLDEALDTAGLWQIDEYIQQRHDILAAHVACRTIYELCTGSERIPGTIRIMRWWEHDVGWELE